MARSKEEINKQIDKVKDRIERENRRTNPVIPTRSGRFVRDTSDAAFNVAQARNTGNLRELDALNRELVSGSYDEETTKSSSSTGGEYYVDYLKGWD
jgi:hypothetical protein